MAAVAFDTFTTAELLDELEQRLRDARNGVGGAEPQHGLHWRFSATGPAPTSAHILRVRLDLAGLSKAAFASAFSVPAEAVEEWLSGASPVPPWVVPAIRVYEMLPDGARRKLLRTRGSQAGSRSGNSHPFARIEEL